MKVSTKKPGECAVVMKNGLICLFPESNIYMIYEDDNIDDWIPHDKPSKFDAEDDGPITLLDQEVKRVGHINVVGEIFAWDRSLSPNRQERIKKAAIS